jgi:hypothetical protein
VDTTPGDTAGTAQGLGFPDRLLTEAEAARVCDETVARWRLDGRRVLVVIPDGTRT